MNVIQECLDCNAYEYVGPDYPDSFLLPFGDEKHICPICPICAEFRGIDL